MSDETVRSALRSDAPLVVVEAPAGCGKTHQGADYAQALAASRGRTLIVTHTHAACSVFSERTKGAGPRVEIRTIDSIIGQIASAYHGGLGLPADTATWVRQRKNGHAELAAKVAVLLRRHPMIAATLAHRHPVVICDEHQDSSGDQNAVVMAMLSEGAKIRIFGDPMQDIFKDVILDGSNPAYDWNELRRQSQAFEELDAPHRWAAGCPDLGKWTLAVRAVLKAGGRVDLRSGLPPSVSVVFTENDAPRRFDYQPGSRKPIDAFEQNQRSLLLLTRYNETARSFRGLFGRRIPLWEGHTRSALETLVDAVRTHQGDPATLAAAGVAFMADVGKGFSPSAFGDRFTKEAREGCTKTCRGKPATLQGLAQFLVTEADHRGIAKMLRRLYELKERDSSFADIEIDGHREFWEAVRLGEFDEVDAGLAEITHRRTYSRPKPPEKAISTIHKAKGLECDGVILMPCDSSTFPDTLEARRIFYVAISRARSRLLLAVSRHSPSPILIF